MNRERRLDEAQGIIYVIDATDRVRLVVAREECELLLTNTRLRNRTLPFLFLVNKVSILLAYYKMHRLYLTQ